MSGKIDFVQRFREVFQTESRIIVSCNKRMATYLQQEIEDLGFNIERQFQTGVELKGTLQECIKLNLNLRCASQVYYSLHSFRCDKPEQLYQKAKELPWEELIDADGYFSVTSNVNHFTVNNPLFINVKVKDAIVDRFRERTGKRPDSGPDLERVVVHVFWREERAEIFLDTSGLTLAKHGYRKIPGKAPMLEALAAATVYASKWDRKSAFINPMCGSGTLAIEALLIASNRRPGLYRENYAFMHLKTFRRDYYLDEFELLKRKVRDEHLPLVIASDISEDAVYVARVNAKQAGVDQFIKFSVCDFANTTIPAGSGGVVFFNPEYGERLGEEQELEETYARIGDFLKKQCKGYAGYIFTGNPNLAKKVGLKASRKIEFYNAKIDCRLLEYELYEGTRRKEKETPRDAERSLGD